MEKSKATKTALMVCMIISAIGIIILESAGCKDLRKAVASIFLFLSGKRALFCNIFLGILASAFCMYIGECVSICVMRKTARTEIIELADKLWPVIYIKPGRGRESYVRNAYEFIKYQSEIKRLHQEYDRKKETVGLIIELLYQLLETYKLIYENDTMKNNNYKFYVEHLEKYKDYIMNNRKFMEELKNEFDKYKKAMEDRIDECVEQITKIEKKYEKIIDLFKKENL